MTNPHPIVNKLIEDYAKLEAPTSLIYTTSKDEVFDLIQRIANVFTVFAIHFTKNRAIISIPKY